jgi:diguanylate cyclase (GGDEF)-like protein
MRKLSLMRNNLPLPEQVLATEAQLAGSVSYLYDFVVRMLNLTAAQADLIRPGFETLDLAICDRFEDWNRVFLHVLDELRDQGVQLEQRNALVQRMRRDGRTLLYRREVGEEQILTTLRDEHRGAGFGIELADHDHFKTYNDAHGHALGDLVLSTTGRLFRLHREGDIGVRWGGDEYLRVVKDLASPAQLGLVGRRDAELVEAFDWTTLDARLAVPRPRLAIGLAYCARPTRQDRAHMKSIDGETSLSSEQWFDPAISVPAGSSYDLARALLAIADTAMYRAKHTPFTGEPRVVQTNVRIVDGRLIEI